MITTQEQHPWKTTARTVFQFLVGLAAIIPFVANDFNIHTPWILGVVGIAAAVTRIMALPQVEAFLKAYLPFLSASEPGD